jgi:peptide/nickel transport system permease protein
VAAYFTRRLGLGAVVLGAVSFLSFWIVAAKINPLWPIILDPNYAQRRAQIAARTGLDDPIGERYWHWISGIFTGGDAGHTILTDTPIWPPVWHGLVITAQLAAGSLVVIVVLSLLIGTLSARRPGSAVDLVLRGFAYFTWSLPVFLVGLVIQQVLFQIGIRWNAHPFPLVGPPHPGGGIADWLRHMTLPILAISFTFVGAYTRYIRSSMLISLRAPYTTVARAKGLTERRLTVRHALRTSLIPFVALVTLDFGNLFSGSLVADVVFRQGGLGSLFLGALNSGDPLQLEALLTVTAIAVVVFALVGDVLVAALDPRVRLR